MIPIVRTAPPPTLAPEKQIAGINWVSNQVAVRSALPVVRLVAGFEIPEIKTQFPGFFRLHVVSK
jgi:hypothetical protein